MEEKDFDQFHYHPQINKNIDGIVLVPKKNKANTQAIKIKEAAKVAFQKVKPTNKTLSIGISLSLIFLFSILPIRILESGSNMNAKAKEGFDKLGDVYQSIQNNDYKKAKSDLLIISKNIKEINDELDDVGQKNIVLPRFSIINDSSINDERFFEIVLSLSKIGNDLIDDLNFAENIKVSAPDNNENGAQLFLYLNKINRDLKSTGNDFNALKLNVSKIDDEKLNDKEKGYLALIKQNMVGLENYYDSAITLTNNAASLVGKDYDRKYLILFQNNTEIRATGGFIGTYGVLTIRDGGIKNIFVDSVYNPDGQISKKIEPPEPLKRITKNWTMRDANWYPDFPTSAKNISNFYEMEGGFTPDGIIAFDTKTFTDLLEITGPIKLARYDVEINKDNFVSITQFKTSIDYDLSQNNPKKFLSDFAPLLLEKLSSLNKENQQKVMAVLTNNILEKHIQFYSAVEDIQNAFVNLDIAGKIKDSNGKDYFAYIDSNIGGFKTNDKIKESLTHTIEIDRDGFPIHEVQITRKHEGSYEWPSGTNYAYMRFYLPKGSSVLAVEDFNKNSNINTEVKDPDIYEENDKTVIGMWQIINPGEEVILKIKYKSSAKISSSSYNLLIQKQAGIISQETTINLNYKNKNYQENFNLVQDKEVVVNLE
ncbi:MAG: DUF4012 domain-containing protein [Patescibacteria group bacterium]|nr:DUF4012 domain-containing protein [Patescibacteria group bacterium]